MKKAYKIHWADVTRTGLVDLGYRYALPQVCCNRCGSTWGNGCFEYPAFDFDFLNEEEFTDERVVDLKGFREIADRICNAAGRSILLVPGACLGPLSGVAKARELDDFLWGSTSSPQVRKCARELLAAEGIDLLTAELSIRFCGRKLDTHLAVQAEPAALVSDESLSRHGLTHCPVCGDFNPPLRKPVVPEGFILRQSWWPKGQHLVTLAETLDVIASEEFIEAVKKHKLSGIKFVDYGRFE
jgi:hypothetical protein